MSDLNKSDDKKLCLYDPDTNEIFFCNKETTLIGRDKTCDLVITGDRSVSRLHAYLTVNEEVACIKDLASTNGTFKNGIRIQNISPLLKGDEISFGLKRYIIVPVREGERLAQAAFGKPLTTVIDHEASNNQLDETYHLSPFVKGTENSSVAEENQAEK
jgi:pSer/pThr/pTyr-binding forkhead associated (FHA) protein